MDGVNAVIVCVDFDDLLAVTLPYNRHHFDRVLVVTSTADVRTPRVAQQNRAEVYVTDAFYEKGDMFNKWAALEEGLDWLGREGWVCLLDADILWPYEIPDVALRKGCLYGPYRRMWHDVATKRPKESQWLSLPRHMVPNQWSGFTQIFHCDDPVLGKPPWHNVRIGHAGVGDTGFQAKWNAVNKIRLPFEVLHIGQPHTNWYGRVTPFRDGSAPKNAEQRQRAMKELKRRQRGVHNG